MTRSFISLSFSISASRRRNFKRTRTTIFARSALHRGTIYGGTCWVVRLEYAKRIKEASPLVHVPTIGVVDIDFEPARWRTTTLQTHTAWRSGVYRSIRARATGRISRSDYTSSSPPTGSRTTKGRSLYYFLYRERMNDLLGPN